MSLGILIKAPEGIVLAAESRVTLTTKTNNSDVLHVNFDNATKLLSFNEPNDHIGVVTYGQAAIGIRTAHSLIPEFESKLGNKKLNVESFAQKLSEFFMEQWKISMPDPKDYKDQNMTFIVGGYNEKDSYGTVYQIDIPQNPKPVKQHNNNNDFGITWGGQREIVDRLIMGYDSRLFQILLNNKVLQPNQVDAIRKLLAPLQLQMPIQFMPLQDCVNLAILFIRTTINTQELTVGLRGCGGDIDLAIITRNNPLKFIRKKELDIKD